MNCNELFFNKIDNEESAYWLGFIAADGCLVDNRNTVQIKLALKDCSHLEKFKTCIQSIRAVKYYSKYCQIRIDSGFIRKALESHGLHPRKSLTINWDEVTKNVEIEMLRHFIRGYFDGDGCWATKGQSQRYRNSVVFTIATGSPQFAEGISDFLNNRGIRVGVFSSKTHNLRVQTCNLQFCLSLYHLMYDNSSICLSRKKTRIETLLGDNL
jgi:hypothetical protein